MASPWKFLARLISPGSEQKRENNPRHQVTPDALAIADPTKKPAEDSLNSAGRAVSDELYRLDQAASFSTELVIFDEDENAGRDMVERGAGRIDESADPALSTDTNFDVTAAHNDTKIKRTVEIASRKERSRSKQAVANGNVSQVFHVVHTADEMDLDEEIRLLRGQLARKLKLQNAQLRKMLERFER